MPSGLPGSLQTRHRSAFFHLKALNLGLRKQTHGEAHGGNWWSSKQRLGWAPSTARGDQNMQSSPTPKAGAFGVEALAYFPHNCPTLQKRVTEEGMECGKKKSLLFCSSKFDMLNSGNTSRHCVGAVGV